MQLIVLDLEMTKAPGGKIIQIGAVLVDTQRVAVDASFNALVDPHELLSTEISELTGLTDAKLVGSGEELRDALNRFWKWAGAKPLMAWGDDIEWLIESTMPFADIRLQQHLRRVEKIDLRSWSVFNRQALLTSDERKHGGLKPTMESFGLEFLGRQHDAQVDAFNTARLALRYLEMSRKMLTIERLCKLDPEA